ncbi:MAG: nickel pincer cofactor biosynthesis protein LarC [Ignavibacteria bacterium]|nr:nickel pincer cofactor biosynthesis protein LarC [Ignavibacteria bacterium]
MRIAYFDTVAGISGDMTLGALVSAGVRVDELVAELSKLKLTGYELTARHIARSGISATKIDVIVSEPPKYHRHLRNINEIIDNSSLNDRVRDRSKRMFYEVALAEAKVHNSTVEKIHFHEVGAIDSLVDIVGTAICLELLGVEKVFSSPVKLGHGGLVKTEHGNLPIPTPATLEILKGYPTILTDIPHELTTPTGAAIVKALSAGTLSIERIRLDAVGYGAGTRDLGEIPNVLRVLLGRIEPEYAYDEIMSVETNIDDMNPEIHPYVIDKLLSAGAHDAYIIPITMKKGRPGVILSTLVERRKLDSILDILFRETTTIGVRIQPIERRKLQRTQRQVVTSFGPVTVKSILRDGREQLVPEFEECKRIASERNLPLVEVYRILESELRA